MRDPASAGVHRRRRLPHAQRQGGSGHERVDGRRLEPRMEAGLGAQGDGQARAPAHLLRGTSDGRQAADRLRPRVLQRCSAPARRSPATATRRRRSGGVPAVLRRAGPLHRGSRDPVRPVDDHRRTRRSSISPRDSRSGCASTPPRSSGWPTPNRSTSATSRAPTAPGASTSSPTRPTRRASAPAPRKLCEFLESDASPINRFTPPGAEPDSVIDVRAIFQQDHRDLAVDKMPSVLLPRKGTFGLIDYEKMFCPDPTRTTSSICGA